MNAPSSEQRSLHLPEAVEMLRRSIDEWNQFRMDNRKYSPELSGADLSRFDLAGADLRLANLEGTSLVDADLSGARLSSAKLNRADLTRATLDGADLLDARLAEATLASAKLRATTLNGADLSRANLRRADMTSANLSPSEGLSRDLRSRGEIPTKLQGTDLTGADLRMADLRDIDAAGAVFKRTRGLYGERRAQGLGTVVGGHTARFRAKGDLLHWSWLKWIGKLRLFGVSTSAVIAITLYAIFVARCNVVIAALHEWAAGFEGDGQFWPSVSWLLKIPRLPLSPYLALQLIAIGCLALGAAIYHCGCPNHIKENGETRWERELGEPMVEYRAGNCSARPWRYICGALFLVGGAYSVGYLIVNAIRAFRPVFLAE